MINDRIFELLQIHDRVIIPTFGAFLKSKGRIVNIIFNEFIKFNDGQLINYISEQEGMELKEATEALDNFVSEIRTGIEDGKEVKINKLGFLYKDDQGRIRFNAEESETESIPVTPPPVIEDDKHAGKVESEPVSEEVVSDTPTLDEPAEEPEDEEDEVVKEAKENTDNITEEEEKTKAEAEEIQAEDLEDEPEDNVREELESKKIEERIDEPEKPEEVIKEEETKTTEPIAGEKLKIDFKPPCIGDKDSKTEADKPEPEEEKKPLIAKEPEVVEEEIILEKEEKPVEEEKGKILQEDPRIIFTPKEEEKEEKKKKSKAWLWILIILVPIIAIAVWVYLDYDYVKSIFKAEEVVVVDQDNTQQISVEAGDQISEDTTAVVVEPEQDIEEVEVVPEQTTEVVEEDLPPPPPKKYHLIAGVFKDKTNADNLVNKLAERGFYADVIGKIEDKYYVCYASFETRADANYELNHIVDEGYEAWLFYY